MTRPDPVFRRYLFLLVLVRWAYVAVAGLSVGALAAVFLNVFVRGG